MIHELHTDIHMSRFRHTITFVQYLLYCHRLHQGFNYGLARISEAIMLNRQTVLFVYQLLDLLIQIIDDQAKTLQHREHTNDCQIHGFILMFY